MIVASRRVFQVSARRPPIPAVADETGMRRYVEGALAEARAGNAVPFATIKVNRWRRR